MRETAILLVDDEPTWRRFLRLALEDEGYDVVEAADGVEALEQFIKMKSCDAVVTDTNMPRMHGVELLLSLRSKQPKLPVVMFFSGLAGSSLNVDNILALGANAVLHKDDVGKVIELLKKLIRKA